MVLFKNTEETGGAARRLAEEVEGRLMHTAQSTAAASEPWTRTTLLEKLTEQG